MKRVDAFMLGLTAFVAVNCGSYFQRSLAPYVTGWGLHPDWHDIFESIGWPIGFYHNENGFYSWSWINCLGNVVVASVLSWLLSRRMAGGPPPLWAGHARQFQYSVAGLLGVSFLVSLALGVGRLGPAWGLAVRNTLCLGGPVVVYAWCLFRRRLGWVRLAIATLGLIALTLAMDFQYSGQFDAEVIVKALLPLGEVKPRADTFEYFGKHYARAFFSLTLVRAVVPVAGLMSGCVLLHAGGPLVRYYYPIVRDWRCEPRD